MTTQETYEYPAEKYVARIVKQLRGIVRAGHLPRAYGSMYEWLADFYGGEFPGDFERGIKVSKTLIDDHSDLLYQFQKVTGFNLAQDIADAIKEMTEEAAQ